MSIEEEFEQISQNAANLLQDNQPPARHTRQRSQQPPQQNQTINNVQIYIYNNQMICENVSNGREVKIDLLSNQIVETLKEHFRFDVVQNAIEYFQQELHVTRRQVLEMRDAINNNQANAEKNQYELQLRDREIERGRDRIIQLTNEIANLNQLDSSRIALEDRNSYLENQNKIAIEALAERDKKINELQEKIRSKDTNYAKIRLSFAQWARSVSRVVGSIKAFLSINYQPSLPLNLDNVERSFEEISMNLNSINDHLAIDRNRQ